MWIARIQTRVLDNDRHTGSDDGGIRRVARNGFGVAQIVEPEVARSLRIDGRSIGACGRTILEVDDDLDVRALICRVQDAGGLVRDVRAGIAHAETGNIALGNGPDSAPDQNCLPE